MPLTKLSMEAFDALAARAGLRLSSDRREQIFSACRYVDAMRERLWRKPAANTEPAHVFVPAQVTLEKRR